MKRLKTCVRLTAAERKELRALCPIPPKDFSQFVRETEAALHIFLLQNQKYSRDLVRQHLSKIRKACSHLADLLEFIVWPKDREFLPENVRASNLIFRGNLSYMLLAQGGSQAADERARLSEYNIKENRGPSMDTPYLSDGQNLLNKIYMPHESAELIKSHFIAVLTALDHAAKHGIEMEAATKGPQQPVSKDFLARELKAIYEEGTGLPTKKSRTGPFAQYLRFCLRVAGYPYKEIMPILDLSYGDTPSPKERRLAKRWKAAQPQPVDLLSWVARKKGDS